MMPNGPRFVVRRAALAALALLAVLSAVPAAARPLDSALAHFAADKFAETEKGLAEVAASGSPQAAAILRALGDGRLMVDPGTGKAYYTDASGTLDDAATGVTVKGMSPGALKKVRLNNAIRSRVGDAIGSLDLVSPDPAKRVTAARTAFATRDPKQVGAVDSALAKEADPDVKAALLQARAAILAASGTGSEEDRLAAIATLKARGDGDALNLVGQIAAAPNASPTVKAAAAAAAASIKRMLNIWQALQNCWYGLSLGSVLLLAAIGLAITFGVMGIINMAHGEMVMLGAYATFVTQQLVNRYLPAPSGAGLVLAVPIAFGVSGAVGIVIERLIIRHLYGRPLETLLATWGVSLVLQQLVRSIFGADNRPVSTPPFMTGSFKLGGLDITYGRMWIVVFTIFVFAALQVVLRATPFGLRMRAVTQNRRMASAMGISTGRIDALAFGLGSGIAGIAGVALSQIDNVSPNLGQSYIIDSFMVVVFGGVGNLWGTLVGAFSLGIADKFIEPFSGAVLAKILILVFIVLFIQRRPRGLFALRGRAVEA